MLLAAAIQDSIVLENLRDNARLTTGITLFKLKAPPRINPKAKTPGGDQAH
jgi:hypothetical protein